MDKEFTEKDVEQLDKECDDCKDIAQFGSKLCADCQQATIAAKDFIKNSP